MKFKFKRTISVILTLMLMFGCCVPTFAAGGDSANGETYGGLSVDVQTSKDKYKATELVKYTLKITNTSDASVDNITIETIFDDIIVPVGKNSEVFVDIEKLEPGESRTMKFNATIDTDKQKINFLQKIVLWFATLFQGKYKKGIRTTEDNRFFFEVSNTITMNNQESTEIFRIRCGEELSAKDRLIKFNDNEIPEVTVSETDNLPTFIDGKFTNRKINDEEDARNALNDLGDIYKDNLGNDYRFVKVDTDEEGFKYYYFEQLYKGLRVYAKQMKVCVNADGETVALSGDYDKIADFDTDPSVVERDAEDILAGIYDESQIEGNPELVIYSAEGSPILAWLFRVSDGDFYGDVFVSAYDGEVFHWENLINSEVATGNDTLGNQRTFNVKKNGRNDYSMIDEKRGIYIYNANGSTFTYNLNKGTPAITSGSLVTSSNNTWPAGSVSLLANLSIVVDYFENNLGRDSFNDRGGLIYAAYNDPMNNAYSHTRVEADYTILCFGSGRDRINSLDTIGHEYMHSVERSISFITSSSYNYHAGSIMEGYSDIFGNIVEGDNDWVHGDEHTTGGLRNLASPENSSQPSRVDGTNFLSSPTSGHHNSTVISHAAYLMNQAGIEEDELGALFLRSLNFIGKTPDFIDCRAAVLSAARNMHLSGDKIEAIGNAFDQVNIVNRNTFFPVDSLGGIVSSSKDNSPIENASVVAFKAIGTEPTITVASTKTDSQGRFSMFLPTGIYILVISAEGFKSQTRVSVSVIAGANYLENSILLDENESGIAQVGGKITNSKTGESIENVTLKFRKDYNNKEGTYVKNEFGDDLVIYTDADGYFYSTALSAGYYTIEATCDGFVTGYKNVVIGTNGDICGSQNFSISPLVSKGSYSVVLSWNEHPFDLDSHLFGKNPDGSQYRVYYRNMNGYDYSGNHKANLDVDDTDGVGPETVTFICDEQGVYDYYVDWYSGDGTWGTSGGKVEVYNDEGLIQTFNVPYNDTQSGSWRVFSIVNGQIVPYNIIQTEDIY